MCRKTEEARNAGPELKVPYFTDLQTPFQRARERQKVRAPVRRQALLILFLGKLFKNPCSQAELNKIVPFGFSLQRQKMVFFLPSK